MNNDPAHDRISEDIPLEDIPLENILGLHTTPERLRENLAAYRTILAESEKLRALDLTDVHPAVIFDPTAAYRKERGR